MKSASLIVLRALLQELEGNTVLRSQIDHQLQRDTVGGAVPQPRRSRNRRAAAALDPYSLFPLGEEHLRSALLKLSVDQLKDIISEYAMDSSRLALKWKVASRLADFIVTTARARLEKGDAFRNERAGSAS
jgi:hypothetical protein